MGRKKKSVPVGETIEQMDRACQRMAMQIAYTQLQEGKAPPSLVNYFVKRADRTELIRTEAMQADAALKRAKVDQIDREKQEKASSEKAIEALRSYKPTEE